jgi:lipase chaperone LimK
MKEIYNRIILQKEKDMPNTIREGIRRLCNEPKQALMATSVTVTSTQYIAYQCHVTKLPRTAIPGSLSFVISKDSPYRELFNYK